MCLIAFAISASPRWPLVIASNRDEFLDRPTLPLARWQAACGQEIISGRDLRAGGTWFGTTPGGRVAFLTNVREASPRAGQFSRGELVTRWLESSVDAACFFAVLPKDDGAYGGFNLVVGDIQRNDWAWLTNKSDAAVSGWQLQTLQPGVYGLSNAGLDTPWPKTVALKQSLAAALADTGNNQNLANLQTSLWPALLNRQRAPWQQLPVTGVPLAMETALSSAFVDFPEHAYGTRSSTLLVADGIHGETDLFAPSWRVYLEERTHLRDECHGLSECAPVAVSLTFALGNQLDA